MNKSKIRCYEDKEQYPPSMVLKDEGAAKSSIPQGAKLVRRECPVCKRNIIAWDEEFYKYHRSEAEAQFDRVSENHFAFNHSDNKEE